MDLTTTTTVATAAVKTPEPDAEAPTRAQQPTAFTNGVLKRHAPLHLHHGHPVVVTYKECLKNHAASMGGHAVDGCGEFIPSPALNPSDPTSLKCGACGCHRNFHRRDPDAAAAQPQPPALEYQPHHRHLPPPPRVSPSNSPSPPPISSTYPHHILMALSNQQNTHHNHHDGAPKPSGAAPILSNSTRKRFRTKFTQDQKDKMLEFAEKVSWKMQKRDEAIINEFCNGIGVEKGVFKVWMHNNKNTSAKKDHQQSPFNTASAHTLMAGDKTINHGNNGVNNYADDEMRQQIHIQNISHGNNGVGTDGSNSSSS